MQGWGNILFFVCLLDNERSFSARMTMSGNRIKRGEQHAMDGPDTWLLFQSQTHRIDLSDVKTWYKLLLRISSNLPFKMAVTVIPNVMVSFKCQLDTACSHIREGRTLVKELWVYPWGLSWSIIGSTPLQAALFLMQMVLNYAKKI